MVIARYKDWKQDFFETYMSPRNKEYCLRHDFEYIEIKNDTPLDVFRGEPTWWKFSIVRDMMNSGKLQDGDIITHLDADMAIVDTSIDYSTKKSFSYSIDSGNTHCMGSYSLKVNDWSRRMIELLLSEERYEALNNDRMLNPPAHPSHLLSFWHQFREQASWYSLAGIKRHSWEPFWDLADFGWHSNKNSWTAYTLEELYEHVEVLPTEYNVTEVEGESNSEFLINKVKNENVFIRHFAGGQAWRKEWFKNQSL